MPRYKNHVLFLYKFGIAIKDNSYLIKYYNTPYKNSNQEADDLSVILTGKDLAGNDFSTYKCVPWETWDEGFYKIEVECHFVKQLQKGRVYDQIFNLLKYEKVDNESFNNSNVVN